MFAYIYEQSKNGWEKGRKKCEKFAQVLTNIF